MPIVARCGFTVHDTILFVVGVNSILCGERVSHYFVVTHCKARLRKIAHHFVIMLWCLLALLHACTQTLKVCMCDGWCMHGTCGI